MDSALIFACESRCCNCLQEWACLLAPSSLSQNHWQWIKSSPIDSRRVRRSHSPPRRRARHSSSESCSRSRSRSRERRRRQDHWPKLRGELWDQNRAKELCTGRLASYPGGRKTGLAWDLYTTECLCCSFEPLVAIQSCNLTLEKNWVGNSSLVGRWVVTFMPLGVEQRYFSPQSLKQVAVEEGDDNFFFWWSTSQDCSC